MEVVREALLCIDMCDVGGVDGDVRGYSEVTVECVGIHHHALTVKVFIR